MNYESYEKFEYKLLKCGGMSANMVLKSLNEFGKEGWEAINTFGQIFKNIGTSDGSILLKRKIYVTKI